MPGRLEKWSGEEAEETAGRCTVLRLKVSRAQGGEGSGCVGDKPAVVGFGTCFGVLLVCGE